ncbi:MAG: hypothetical protein NC898_03080 [Candidatus Omnitrophica bacterium]|nr:hypothetical protein [Candidatus Omnitrophota bacterium]
MKIFGEKLLNSNPNIKVYFVVKEASFRDEVSKENIDKLLGRQEFTGLKELKKPKRFQVIAIIEWVPFDFSQGENINEKAIAITPLISKNNAYYSVVDSVTKKGLLLVPVNY